MNQVKWDWKDHGQKLNYLTKGQPSWVFLSIAKWALTTATNQLINYRDPHISKLVDIKERLMEVQSSMYEASVKRKAEAEIAQ
jgi:hypothetical protein